MAKQQTKPELMVRCECGFEVRGTLDELVPQMRKHGLEAHNMKVTRAGVASRAQPV